MGALQTFSLPTYRNAFFLKGKSTETQGDIIQKLELDTSIYNNIYNILMF